MRRSRVLPALMAAGTMLATAACGGGSEGAATTSAAPAPGSPASIPTSSTSSSSSAASTSRPPLGEDRSSLVNGYQPPAAIAVSQGLLDVYPDQDPHVAIEVLALRATSASTLMHLRLRPAKKLNSFKMWAWSEDWSCLDRIKLVDVPRGKVYGIGLSAVADRQDSYKSCLTDKLPGSASHDKPLYAYAYYGPLPAGTKQMTLRMKGFADTAVPVTWSAAEPTR